MAKQSSSVKTDSDIVERVRALAWAGQHAQAIGIASQELGRSDWSRSIPKTGQSDLQMDLLDLRAESYIAQGKLDLATKDANAMMKLASMAKTNALKAQALIRKGVIQGFQKNHEKSINTLTSALKIARKNRTQHLEAQSLFWLAWNHLELGLNEQAILFGQHAADLYLSLHNPSAVGRALRIVAFAHSRLGNREESINLAQTALTLCEQVGDNLGKGDALNAWYVNELDLALALKRLKEARQAIEASGYVIPLEIGRAHV